MKVSLAAILCLIGIWALFSQTAAAVGFVGQITSDIDGKKWVQVYAHRGARSYAPENTIPGYAVGLSTGTDWVDMDIGMTADGQIVVTHDIWLNPDIVRRADGKFIAAGKDELTGNASGRQLDWQLHPFLIKNLTYARLTAYDVGRINPSSPYRQLFPAQYGMDGVHIPLLADVIRFVRQVAGDQVGFQIEFKTDPAHPDWTVSPREFAVALYEVLKREEVLDQCEIQSFDWRCLYELQKIDPAVATAYLTSTDNQPGGVDDFYSGNRVQAGLWTGGFCLADYNYSIPQMVKSLGGRCWEPEDRQLTMEALYEAHALGLKVVVWSWPEKSGNDFDPQMIGKLIDWGVDGIITDDPARLVAMLAARGHRLPPRFVVRPYGDE